MNEALADWDLPHGEVGYPESDGKPMGETDLHITALIHLLSALRWIFRKATDVYVAADMVFYYEEGKPSASVSPDVFVVQGTARHPRRTWKTWEEKAAPALVIELTSRSSRIEDMGTKRGLYEMLGVKEYLLFDPLGEYLKPRFRVFELEDGLYQPAAIEEDERFESHTLGVTFHPEGPLLRILDPVTGALVPLLEEATDETEEAHRQATEALRQAAKEARRAEEAEREVRRLRALLGESDGEDPAGRR